MTTRAEWEEINKPNYTEKDARLAALLEPDLPESAFQDSPKGMYHYEAFSIYYIQTRDASSDLAKGPGWVPHLFTTNLMNAFRAEGLLPENKRLYYARRLCKILGVNAEDLRKLHGCWKLRRATPEQMVDAMIATLEFIDEPAEVPTT